MNHRDWWAALSEVVVELLRQGESAADIAQHIGVIAENETEEWEAPYLVCFDFPQTDEPVFAGWIADGTVGFTPSLAKAWRFAREVDAERCLAESYDVNTRPWGAVVEAKSASADEADS